MAFFDFFTSDIAIDLGTANTLIIYKDKIVVDEPSIIALDKVNSKVLAIGREAMQMHEKTHDHIKTIRPLKEGVIADFQAAEMITINQIEPENKHDRNRYIKFPYRLYANCPQWVPPLYSDVELQMDQNKHPFYEHSEAAFFIAEPF